MEHQKQSEFLDVVDTLLNMFSDVISRDVVYAVVENCGGELHQAAEVLMNMSNEFDSPQGSRMNQQGPENGSTAPAFVPPQASSSTYPNSQPAMSYANISQSQPPVRQSGVTIVSKTQPIKTTQQPPLIWTDQVRKIVEDYNKGYRQLLLMRGASGSGKSFLAKEFITLTIGSAEQDFKTHIFSTDNFFMRNGVYYFDKHRLDEAHRWNQNLVRIALQKGLSPIIVDNTNLDLWEFKEYAKNGVKFGYILEVVEPSTPWAKKANQLYKKSTHDVPLANIRRMLDKYQEGITGPYLLKAFNLKYSPGMVPPVMRYLPKPLEPIMSPYQNTTTNLGNPDNSTTTREETEENATAIIGSNLKEAQKSDSTNVFRFKEMQSQIQDYEIVEKAWEQGEQWNEETPKPDKTNTKTFENVPKPERQRQRAISSSSSQKQSTMNIAGGLSSSDDFNDWHKLSLTPWDNQPLPCSSKQALPANIEKIDASTHIESGDTRVDESNTLKIINANPRDINHFYIPRKEKIPEVRMLDKSTVTADTSLSENFMACPFTEKHFNSFRRHFADVPIEILRDVFEKCCGDVNWAYNIVMDGRHNETIPITVVDNEEISDNEDTDLLQCECFAKYDIIPSNNPEATSQQFSPIIPEASNEVTLNKKGKKDKALSESNIELKRQIEHNVVFSDRCYSQQSLKIRKMRRGEDENSDESPNSVISQQVEQNLEENQPGTSKCLNKFKSEVSDNESISSLDESERTVNLNLGTHFISQLDQLYEREDMKYPSYIEAKINIPVSLLNEINALWMESIMHQFGQNEKQSAEIVKQDEEFASELATKENELAEAGQEPEIPDFKEIMDLDLAVSLYHKDVAEWRNNEPGDMAAKMTREKLCNLFPDILPDVLGEILMAHDNNFKNTVESLLISMGKADVLQEKNGINKFVMKKELERQEMILQHQQKALSAVEWPLLPEGGVVEMSTVERYRSEAEKHLNRRNLCFQKAQQSIQRGMTQVASYYSDVATYHKNKYEHANSLAAASLMQVNALRCSDNATIDLHFLRVVEARESLDIFLDSHITKLKNSQHKQGPKFHTLFFITGRGLHSTGGPRIKPAVRRRLHERGLMCSERNPGLLTARVSADDKLTYQLS